MLSKLTKPHKTKNMKKHLALASSIFGLLGTIIFVQAVFTCNFNVALPSMMFASFWIIVLCKTPQN
jgi:hypothetical protein